MNERKFISLKKPDNLLKNKNPLPPFNPDNYENPYRENKTEFIQNEIEYKIIDTVVEISDSAIQNNYLEKLILPVSLKKIGNSGIKNCISLKSIEYPISVSYFPDDLFEGSSLIETVKWIGNGSMKDFSLKGG